MSGRPSPAGPADTVLVGGRIAIMDPDQTLASAVAVRAGRIVAVGDDAAARERAWSRRSSTGWRFTSRPASTADSRRWGMDT